MGRSRRGRKPAPSVRSPKRFTPSFLDRAGYRHLAFDPLERRLLLTGVMNVRYEVDAPGPVSALSVGENFTLKVFVQDARTNPAGVYQAYFDLAYNTSIASVTGPISHGSVFNVSGTTSGDTSQAGKMNDAGGATSDSGPPGGIEELLFSVPMQATGAGQFDLTPSLPTNPTENTVLWANLSNQSIQVTSTSQINFSGLPLTVSSAALQFSSATYNANETDGSATITVVRTGSSSGAVSVTVGTSNGSATAGTDYTGTTQTVNWADGDTTNKTVSIPLLDDNGNGEGTQTVNLTLSNATGGIAIGSPGTATLNIAEDNEPGSLQFSAATYNANETDGSATITLTRTGGSLGAVSVTVGTSNGSATAGTDYTTTSQTVSWADGDTANKTISVPLLDDNGNGETAQTVNLALTNVTGGAALGAQNAASLSIAEDNEPGSLQFSAATYNANETDGSATITLTRTGGSSGAVSVTVGTSNGTATAGTDYTGVTQTVSWADGDTANKTISVPLLDDNGNGETAQTVNLALSNATGGATLGPQSTASLSIAEDNEPGSLQFSAATYNANETDGSATITITRTGGSSGAVSVTVGTSNGTATAGTDYTTTSQTVTWADGDTANKTITIPLLDDNGAGETAQTVNLALSNVTGSATLGAQATATLTIAEDNEPGSLQFSAATYNANETDGSATITITRTGGSSGAVSVTVGTSDGSATAGTDYTTTSQTVSWADGDTANKTITIPLLDDNGAGETSQTVNLALSNVTGSATLGTQNTASLSIAEDNEPGALQFSAATYNANETDGSATITITRTGGSSGAVSVTVGTSNGTATAGTDYTTTSQTVSWASGDIANKTITIPLLDDNGTGESAQTVNLTLSALTGGATLGTQGTATLSIAEDADAPGQVQFSAATYNANETDPTATITVTRTGGSSGAVSVTVGTSNGTATAGTDYTTTSQTVSWADGDSANKTITIPLLDDNGTGESAQTVNLALSNVTGGAAVGTQNTATLSIAEDTDTPGSLQFSAATYNANETDGTATITLTRTGGSTGAVSVTVGTSDGSATAGTDYTTTSQTVSWADGDTANKTITVPLLDDNGTGETAQTVNLALSNVTGGATVGTQNTATLTIAEDNEQGVLQFSAATYNANETGGSATITLTRTVGSTGAVSVTVGTSDGTATAGTDYTTTSQTVSWADGDTANKTITIPLLDDNGAGETTQTVNLALSNVTGGATLGTQGTATLSIAEDNEPGALGFSAATFNANETDASATITLTRTGGSSGAVSVTVGTSNGTATAGTDYTTTTQTVSWADGDTANKTVTIPLVDDNSTGETTQTVNLTLSGLTGGATIGTQGTATLSIAEDNEQGALGFSAATYNAIETDGTATITLTRTGGSVGAVSVTVGTSNGTATAGTDYTTTSQTVSWADGDTANKTITIPLLDDNGNGESAQTVNLALSNATGGATVGTQNTATLSIAEDNEPGSLQFSAATYNANETDGTATITLTRTGGSLGAVSVTVGTSNGTATAGTDYTTTSQTVNWADGDTANKTITIPLLDDNGSGESAQTVNLALSNATGGASLGTQGTATLNIAEDNEPGSVQFSAATYNANETDGTATITLTRTGGSLGAVSVTVGTSNGSATAGTDYTATTQTVTWADGDTANKTITIPLLDDNGSGESAQTVNLGLSNVTGASLGTQSTAILSIAEDSDIPGQLQFSSATYNANETDATATITLTRTGGSSGSVSVTVGTSNGSATAGTDYTATSQTVTWADGDTANKTITIPLLDDNGSGESAQTVNLALTNLTGGATLGAQGGAILTIAEDSDVQPGSLQFSAATYNANETDGSATITVTRTGGSTGSVSVTVGTSNGSATAGTDYTTTTQTLTWADGDTANKTITIPLLDDNGTGESAQTVNLALSNVTGGATLGTQGTASLSIAEDSDSPGQVQFSAATYNANETDPTATITLTRTGGSSGAISVTVGTSNGSATAGTDYTATTQTVSWADGDTANKTITIPLLDDNGTGEGAQTVNLALSNLTGGATLGAQGGAILTLAEDSDTVSQPGSVQFSAATYNASETDPTATITLTRTGGSSGAVSVTVGTSDGTATAGTDYTATTQTVSWADGDSANKTITIPLLDDSDTGESTIAQTVNLTLSHTTGGVTLGTQNTATLSIAEEASIVSGSLVGLAVVVPQGTTVTSAPVATFTAAGGTPAAGDFSATIDWGDGSSSAGVITASSNGFTVTGSHNYASPGQRTMKVTVQPTGGTASQVPTTATVGSDNERFVAQAYRDLLSREVEPQGLQFWTSFIAGGHSRQETATNIEGSPEARNDLVNGLYRLYLHRPADPTALAADAALLANGGTPEKLSVMLTSSTEYFQFRGASTGAGFLHSLYTDVFNRDIDAAALQVAGPVDYSSVANRMAVVQTVFGSSEYLSDLISFPGTNTNPFHDELPLGFYQAYLGRAADATALSQDVASLEHGGYDNVIVSQIIGSDEYFARAGHLPG